MRSRRSKQFGLALRAWRIKANLGQTEFGKLVGVSRQTVSLWETGETGPFPPQVMKLREVMGAAFPPLEDTPPAVQQIMDEAKDALDAWYAEFRGKLSAAMTDAGLAAQLEPELPDGSGHIEATAARELLSRSAASPAPAAQDAAPTRRRK